MSGYIYMIGGYYSGPKYDAYQYHISSNTWSGMSDESISRPARVILIIWRNLNLGNVLTKYLGLCCYNCS